MTVLEEPLPQRREPTASAATAPAVAEPEPTVAELEPTPARGALVQAFHDGLVTGGEKGQRRLCPFSHTARPVIGDNGPFLRYPG